MLAHDLCVAENDRPLKGHRPQKLQDRADLLQRRDGDGILRDVGTVFRVRLHGDLDLVALIHPRDGHDLLRDGRGEQAEIAAVPDLFNDLRHIVEKAHVEHTVRLVEDDRPDLVEPERLALIVVHEPSRRGDDDLRAFLKLLDLRLDLRAAVDHGHADVLGKRQKTAQLVSDLDGKLARRREDKPLKLLRVGVDVLDHRDAEGKGLARSGGCLCDDVLPLHQRRDRLLLDSCGISVSLLFQRLKDLV